MNKYALAATLVLLLVGCKDPRGEHQKQLVNYIEGRVLVDKQGCAFTAVRNSRNARAVFLILNEEESKVTCELESIRDKERND